MSYPIGIRIPCHSWLLRLTTYTGTWTNHFAVFFEWLDKCARFKQIKSTAWRSNHFVLPSMSCVTHQRNYIYFRVSRCKSTKKNSIAQAFGAKRYVSHSLFFYIIFLSFLVWYHIWAVFQVQRYNRGAPYWGTPLDKIWETQKFFQPYRSKNFFLIFALC